ncbi:hypothetical protein OIO90_002000 [Microbotryomycetes sp. JL221]|nr:hypothetical protein OIO90_002000 [Microbotryomycetes sp. JL221]
MRPPLNTSSSRVTTQSRLLLIILVAFASNTVAYDHSQIGHHLDPTWEADKKRYLLLAIIHSGILVVAWQILAPIAVATATLGRSWRGWIVIHWSLQLVVLIATAVASIVGAAMTRIRVNDPVLHPSSYDKHRIMGIVIIGITFLQVAIGYGMHLRRTNTLPFETRADDFAARRTWVNWIHILLGLSLLTLTGITVAWAFVDFKLEKAPTWIHVVNWCLIGLPPCILAPLILVRGYRRLKRGQTFAQAFLNAPVHQATYELTRKTFLNEADYLVEAAVLGRNAPAREQGYTYDKGKGAEGRQLIADQPVETGWQGVATREAYEMKLQASTNEVLYDAPAFEKERKLLEERTKLDRAPSLPPIEPLFQSSSTNLDSNLTKRDPASRVAVPAFVPPLSPGSPLALTLPPPQRFPSPGPHLSPSPARSASVTSTQALSQMSMSLHPCQIEGPAVERSSSLSVVGSVGHSEDDDTSTGELPMDQDDQLKREASGRWFGNRRS